jgi:catechol 2,3-dioxygenase
MTSQTEQPTRGIVPPGFRLPADTSVGTVKLLVSDLTRSVAYYDHVLGLSARSLSSGAVVLTPRGGDRPLVQLEARPGVRSAPRRASLGLYHFAVLLPERAALGRFLAHVSSIGIATGMSNHLVSEAIYLTDPDGLGIEVYADRPRSEWSYRGRQIVMATEPLDARALVAAGEGKRWEGAPAGTVMGHVHLHVADLVAAEAFYHAGLGFDKVVWDYPGALFLSAGGYHHHLGTNTWSANVPPAADQARLLSWDLELPTVADAEAAARSLEGAGYRVDRQKDVRVAADPWGTTLRLVARTADHASVGQ